MNRRGNIAIVFILTGLILQVQSHSFLTYPLPDWTNPNRPECRIGGPDDVPGVPPMHCPGPCGTDKVEENGGVFFNPNSAATAYRRGDKVVMKWTRNNHQSGFVRFTLVPKQDRMAADVHNQYAFHYACWEAGERHCGPDELCGTDEERKMFETEVEIPRVYPDGEYVLGWSWYGGTRYRDGGPKSEYGDYYSCANIAIQGSTNENGETTLESPIEAFTPVFKPGTSNGKNTCYASVNQLGICVTEPCYARYPGAERVPAPFDNDQIPPPILRRDLESRMHGSEFSTSLENRSGNPGSAAEFSGCSGSSIDSAYADCPRVTMFEVIDVSNGAVLASIDAGGSASVASGLSGVNVLAATRGSVTHVDFLVDGTPVRRETTTPYFSGGDNNGMPLAWDEAPRGRWFTLTATAYGKGSKASGTVHVFIGSS